MGFIEGVQCDSCYAHTSFFLKDGESILDKALTRGWTYSESTMRCKKCSDTNAPKRKGVK